MHKPLFFHNIDGNKSGKFGACMLFCSGDLCSFFFNVYSLVAHACAICRPLIHLLLMSFQLFSCA